MAGRRRKKKSFSNFLGMMTIAGVVLILLAVITTQTNNLRIKDAEVAAREESYQAEYDRESERAEELEEERIRVQTRQYIEEMAKSRLGLVYPGEIILQPRN